MEIDIMEFIRNWLAIIIIGVGIIVIIVHRILTKKRKQPIQENIWIPAPQRKEKEENKNLYDVGDIPSKIEELEKKKSLILSEASKLKKEMQKRETDSYYNSMILKMKKEELENRIKFLKEFQSFKKQ